MLSYDSVMAVRDEQISDLGGKLDSLPNLQRSEEYLFNKLDSATDLTTSKIDTLKKKVMSLKSDMPSEINTPDLPADLEDAQSRLNQLTEDLNISFPQLETSSGSDIPASLSEIEYPFSDQTLPRTGNINLRAGELTATPISVDEATMLVEDEVTRILSVDEIKTQISETDKLTDMMGPAWDQQSVADELTHQAQEQAVDHFLGKEKEEQLQKAMETLAKYKKKYSSVQGIEDIARKRRNPLKDKPFIERLVPGIALQIHRKDSWMVDFNLYSGYRFSPRFTAGAGWNQRIAYDADDYEFEPDLRIYGPRTYGEFAIGEGFSARLEMEYMNTRLPPQFSSGQADVNGREWVFSALAGIKKEYRFLKDVKGTMMLLHNLHDPHHRSPYVDKLMVRFGFEFPMKKNTAETGRKE
ncbi:MAG TPA: hypothetical protein VKZ75_00330 [Cyclobacteriaceae bacterium]|nr:hypothetical protein [Cyclobacteriaceae bacterium]